MKKIYFLIVCCLLLLQVKAQQDIPARLEKFYAQIDSVLIATPEGKCKTAIGDYRSGFASLDVRSVNAVLQRFHQLNNSFTNQSASACKWFMLRVKSIDSITASNAGLNNDSAKLLFTFTRLKNKASGFVRAELRFKDEDEEGLAPSVSVISQWPSMLVRNAEDSTASHLFIRPDGEYLVQVNSPTHDLFQLRLAGVQRDTTYILTLQSGLQPVSPPIGPVTPGSKKFLWLSIALALLSAFLLWKLFSRRTSVGAPAPAPPPATQKASETKPVIEQHLVDPLSQGRYFVVEMMMTAGPRKKPMGQPNADVDLGEDVCGFIITGKHALLWILDGSSDYFSLKEPSTGREYFSSRLLAQSIARKLRAAFHSIGHIPLNELMLTILAEVKRDWGVLLNALPEQEKQILIKNINSGNFPVCAATALVAQLSDDGSLLVYRSGDCRLFLYEGSSNILQYRDSSLTAKHDEKIFFRLAVEDGALGVLHSTPEYELVQEQGVRAVIGVSDGVAAETVALLKNSFAQKPEIIRNELIRAVQGTDDDKSLCILEIKE